MQQAFTQQATPIKFQSQAADMLPGHGTGTKNPASNDDIYQQETSAVKMVLSVLANVVGGIVLLAALFNLPVILAAIWGL